ncbi:hypothetical protein [Nocardia salmonicida]|uniref:hypothetical protein n=1 Tax=Nocardia salmonicida TaxID=53431 RepID=UPI0007A54657|nr:hypothetical protein [Nocardia salmonicida]
MTFPDNTYQLAADHPLAQLTTDAAALADETSLRRDHNHYAVGVSAGPGCWWRVAIAEHGSEHRVAATLLDPRWWSRIEAVRVWVLAPSGDIVLAMTGSPDRLRRELIARDVHPMLRPAVTAWRMRTTPRPRRDALSTHPALDDSTEVAQDMMANLFASDHLVAFSRVGEDDVQNLVADNDGQARDWALIELAHYADNEEIRIWHLVGGVILRQAAGPAAEVRRAVASWNTPAWVAPIVAPWRIRRAAADPRSVEWPRYRGELADAPHDN